MKAAVVVTYHDERALLVRAIASLDLQTRQADSLIVVDTSPDGSAPTFTWTGERAVVRAPCANTARARNAGVRVALAMDADVIGFLDADDEYLPRKLENSILALDQGVASIVSSGMIYVDEREDPHRTAEIAGEPVSLGSLAERCNIYSNQVVDANVFRQRRIYFPEYFRVAEDYAWVVQCAAAGVRILTLAHPHHVYHKRPGSKTVRLHDFKEEESRLVRMMARAKLAERTHDDVLAKQAGEAFREDQEWIQKVASKS